MKMRLQSKINICAGMLFLASCLLSGCIYDDDEYGLAISPSWADEADKDVEVKDVKLWIFNTDKDSLVEEKHYSTMQELAGHRFLLPKGNYRILSAVNLTEPFFIGEATRAPSSSNDFMIGLANPVNVKSNAYFVVTDAIVRDNNAYTIAKSPLKGVLAELTIVIEDVPQGAELGGKVLDAADCLLPTRKNSDGEYGLPGADTTMVELPGGVASGSSLQSDVVRLMPTVPGGENSHLFLRISHPDGVVQEYDITAPVMKAGGKYEIRFKHSEMKPKMNLESGINNWKDLSNEVEIK